MFEVFVGESGKVYQYIISGPSGFKSGTTWVNTPSFYTPASEFYENVFLIPEYYYSEENFIFLYESGSSLINCIKPYVDYFSQDGRPTTIYRIPHMHTSTSTITPPSIRVHYSGDHII